MAWPPAVALHTLTGVYGLASEWVRQQGKEGVLPAECDGASVSQSRGESGDDAGGDDTAGEGEGEGGARAEMGGASSRAADSPRLQFALLFGGLARSDHGPSVPHPDGRGQGHGHNMPGDAQGEGGGEGLRGHASSSWDGLGSHAETLAELSRGKHWERVDGKVVAIPTESEKEKENESPAGVVKSSSAGGAETKK